ncbi:hypothetical protein GQ44DRAFT_771842 [Phaeosphaeriaceae sp. PMI808]|nr:hypothetical protein GQ44DRAFT_771842 [Phaeosphaeriaceae sp. PMI808]
MAFDLGGIGMRYIEFGDALHRLHSNLNTIEEIVKAANTNLDIDRVGTFGPRSYDITSLTEIIGNFQLTLEECRDFLNDGTKFRQKAGFITNIIYNINVDPQVVCLTERLAFHSTKISLVLDPFNIHVQTQLRDLHKEQHQDIAEHLQEVKQLLISSRNPNLGLTLQVQRDLSVPIELSSKFAYELRKRTISTTDNNDVNDIEMPLLVKVGLEAFFGHFDETSQVADSMSYIRLMKSIWIMDKIRESNDWHKLQRTNPGGLYDRCVREMDRRLRAKCTRVAESRMLCPQLSMILQLPEESFCIWPKALLDSTPTQAAHLGVLLEVSILPDMKSHTLRVVQNLDGTLGVEDTTVATSRSSGIYSSDRVIHRLDIDLEKAYLVPLYAVPSKTSNHTPSLTMKVRGSQDGTNGFTPEFKSEIDLFRLQHLITGYKCVKQRKDVCVKSLARGQDFPNLQPKGKSWSRKTKTDIIEVGNIQLWQRSPYGKVQAESLMVGECDRRQSGTSSPHSPSSRSLLSISSVATSMCSVHTQRISLGSSCTAIQVKQPEPPLLVLFLKHDESGQLSYLVIQLDERTKIEAKSCGCRGPKNQCTISVFERSDTPLIASRFYARSGLDSWNLAAIGEYWPSTNAGVIQVRDMYWLRIQFKSEDERISFNKNVFDLQRIFRARMEDFHIDLTIAKETHIIKQAA